MAKHDSKQGKIQVDTIENRNDALPAILITKKLRGSEAFDNSDHPLNYIMWKDIENIDTSAKIRPYDPDVSTDQDGVISFFIDGTRYIFISQIDGNDSVPSFDNNTYQVAGLYKKSNQYTEADLIEESYGGAWYLSVDLQDRDIVSIGINMASEPNITRFIDKSLAYLNTSIPATIISGFPTNEVQTIIIKTI